MARTLLQDMVEGKPFGSLPANWSSFDLKGFSRQKQLWDYQREAVASAAVVSEKMSEEILAAIAIQPEMTIAGLAREIGVTTRTIERGLKALQEKGHLKRIGPDKGGRWEVLR